MSEFFQVGMKMVFRLRDEPEQFRAGEVVAIIQDEGKRLDIQGIPIDDIYIEDKFEDDIMILDKAGADIKSAYPGLYLASDIAFVHILKPRKMK